MSQAALARAMGIQPGLLSKTLAEPTPRDPSPRKPRLTEVRRAAEALGTTTDYLLGAETSGVDPYPRALRRLREEAMSAASVLETMINRISDAQFGVDGFDYPNSDGVVEKAVLDAQIESALAWLAKAQTAVSALVADTDPVRPQPKNVSSRERPKRLAPWQLASSLKSRWRHEMREHYEAVNDAEDANEGER